MKCKHFCLSDLEVTGVPPRYPYHCGILPCYHHACKINWALAHGRVYTLLKIYCQLLIYGLDLQSSELSTGWCGLFESFQLFHTTIIWCSWFQRDPGLLFSSRTVIRAESPLSSVSDEPQMSQEFGMRQNLEVSGGFFFFFKPSKLLVLKSPSQHLFRTTYFLKISFFFHLQKEKAEFSGSFEYLQSLAI